MLHTLQDKRNRESNGVIWLSLLQLLKQEQLPPALPSHFPFPLFLLCYHHFWETMCSCIQLPRAGLERTSFSVCIWHKSRVHSCRSGKVTVKVGPSEDLVTNVSGSSSFVCRPETLHKASVSSVFPFHRWRKDSISTKGTCPVLPSGQEETNPKFQTSGLTRARLHSMHLSAFQVARWRGRSWCSCQHPVGEQEEALKLAVNGRSAMCPWGVQEKCLRPPDTKVSVVVKRYTASWCLQALAETTAKPSWQAQEGLS